LAFKGTAEEAFKVEYISTYTTKSPIKMIFPFTQAFDGFQFTTIEGSNADVPCYVQLQLDVDYLAMGEFLPDTCEFNFFLMVNRKI
jgi:hypothetical protein